MTTAELESMVRIQNLVYWYWNSERVTREIEERKKRAKETQCIRE